MKYLIIAIFGLSTLTAACTYRPKEKRLSKFKDDKSEILESFYKKTTDTIEFKRILSKGVTLKVQSGEIFHGDHALTHQAVTEVLKEEDLLDHVLIAKRIMTTKEDWSYEVVFPTEYEGVFNQM
jgi:hypothetical protein